MGSAVSQSSNNPNNKGRLQASSVQAQNMSALLQTESNYQGRAGKFQQQYNKRAAS